MPTFTPSLSAPEVDARLRTALTELRVAEESAVLWFSDIVSRKLYRDLGYASIHQYALEALGFSRARTFQFVRLAERLQELPRLKDAVASGSVPWTKAREVAKVATPETEDQWVQEAMTQSRRELERKVEATREQAKAARRRRSCPEQVELLPTATEGDEAGNAAAGDPPVEVSFRFTALEYARFEGLMERLRKSGVKEKREEVLLAALEVMAVQGTRVREMGEGEDSGEEPRKPGRPEGETGGENPASDPSASSQPIDSQRVTRGALSRSPYRIVVLVCPACGEGKVNTSRGARPLSAAALRAIACDADVECDGKNRATVPPRLRRAVLARDRHRCRIASCGSTRFIQVHHSVLREHGGPNTLENLISVCHRCHAHLHEIEERDRWRRRVG